MAFNWIGFWAVGTLGSPASMNYSLLGVGAYADFPAAAAANKGARVLATDAGHLDEEYYSDGAAWQPLPSLSKVAQTITGVKTFASIPVLPGSDPTTDNQAARKLYVDTQPTDLLFRPQTVGRVRSSPSLAAAPSGAQALAGGTEVMHAVPFIVAANETLDRIQINVTTAGETTTVARLGIYASGSDGRPAALVVDGGTVTTVGLGLKTVTISQALTRGLYWLVIVVQAYDAGVTPQFTHFATTEVIPVADAADVTGARVTYYTRSGAVAGALPDPFTNGGSINVQTGAMPAIALRKA